ncbi:hypothetical protein [Clavibacter nebraskensis]|uniref:hypothetical protein n=1 Tax=Clavibacter nebraskensis TaxID=31963 RepID=UPI002010B4F7|nr:hypothetical protein [Clavibacter nebraskensis]UQB17864.1 hypothetical protein LIX22_003003 [Clavibacter nebraskensis]
MTKTPEAPTRFTIDRPPGLTTWAKFGKMERTIATLFSLAVVAIGVGVIFNQGVIIGLASPFAALALAMTGGARGRWVAGSFIMLGVSVAVTAAGLYDVRGTQEPIPPWATRGAGVVILAAIVCDALALRAALYKSDTEISKLEDDYKTLRDSPSTTD